MFQHLKIDILKIDKGFLIQKEDKEKNRIILESITNLCHRLGIKTVAEGVETQEDINLMKELNCRPNARILLWKTNAFIGIQK